MGQSFSEAFPPKAKWLPTDMPDMTGKVAIVTGGNSGMGKVSSKYLLLKNCTVYIFCRSASKAEEAIAELKRATGKEAHFVACDLADLESVKTSAKEFMAKEQRLDILFNNAGVMMTPMDQLTKQGYDMQFGTNVLGHAYLTLLLLPVLQSTATTFGSARVVTNSSTLQSGAPKGGVDWATVKDGPARKKMSTFTAYNQSKWANVVFANELARRYGSEGIVSTSLHPGLIRTELGRHSGLMAFGTRLLGNVVDPLGATTQLYAGTAPEAASLNGKYLIPWARTGLARKDTEDTAAGQVLWKWIQEQIPPLA